MGKRLSEMSLEELWMLFPIYLTEHSENWALWYEDEAGYLSEILAEQDVVQISHIGSTAIKGIWAKPIVDILVEIPVGADMQVVKNILVENGYICMTETDQRISFNKGYTEEGFAEKVYHLHLRFCGDRDEVLFRDYLNGHPEAVRAYEELKLGLWKQYEHNRDAYTEKKTEFVTGIMRQARLERGQL